MQSHQLLAIIAAILYNKTVEQEYGTQRAIENAIFKAKLLLSKATEGC